MRNSYLKLLTNISATTKMTKSVLATVAMSKFGLILSRYVSSHEPTQITLNRFSADISLIARVRVRVIGHLYSALLWDVPIARKAQIWPVIARGSHSFTCHPLTNHICLYSPAAGYHCPLVGSHSAYPSRRDGQAELTWVTG